MVGESTAALGWGALDGLRIDCSLDAGTWATLSASCGSVLGLNGCYDVWLSRFNEMVWPSDDYSGKASAVVRRRNFYVVLQEDLRLAVGLKWACSSNSSVRGRKRNVFQLKSKLCAIRSPRIHVLDSEISMAHLKSTETSTDIGTGFLSHTPYGRRTVVQIKIDQTNMSRWCLRWRADVS